jgi:hypothetical protein
MVIQVIYVAVRMATWLLTKMRMSLASCCQRSAIFWSSSSAMSEYKEKRGPEGSPKFTFFLGGDGVAGAGAGAGSGSGAGGDGTGGGD